ncbi:hypothetical protein [Nonomuraea sp. NPDC046570]|uniref:hypothetical protein n=1 Tax=Nonomuraea sp. NPDC046570 TaxID=3155255 RepID=UPI0033D91D41
MDDKHTETAQDAQGCGRPSYSPAGVPMWHGDADAGQSAEQAVAEQAALIQFGRATAPRALSKPNLAHVDVEFMTDVELTDLRKLMERRAHPSHPAPPTLKRFMGELAKALKAVEEQRVWVWLQFMDDPSIPPDWDTAVAALPQE